MVSSPRLLLVFYYYTDDRPDEEKGAFSSLGKLV